MSYIDCDHSEVPDWVLSETTDEECLSILEDAGLLDLLG